MRIRKKIGIDGMGYGAYAENRNVYMVVPGSRVGLQVYLGVQNR